VVPAWTPASRRATGSSLSAVDKSACIAVSVNLAHERRPRCRVEPELREDRVTPAIQSQSDTAAVRRFAVRGADSTCRPEWSPWWLTDPIAMSVSSKGMSASKFVLDLEDFRTVNWRSRRSPFAPTLSYRKHGARLLTTTGELSVRSRMLRKNGWHTAVDSTASGACALCAKWTWSVTAGRR
jgi:hypothetical protein